jgi:DNA polymerase III epsilon subunit-like protein
MTITEVIRDNFTTIKNLYLSNDKNITHTAQQFCEEHGYKYNDSWRRALSTVLSEEEISPEAEKKTETSPAKILVFDIETAPTKAYVWGGWNQNPAQNIDMVQSEWFMLTWSAKWLFEDKIMTGKLTSKEALNEDDSRITKAMWELFDEADVVIAHNAIRFDVKKLNTRFLLHGLSSPSHYQVIDTLVHARKRFSLISNKLDYLARFLGLEGKLQHGGFITWKKCLEGDEEAFNEMEEYNIQDVRVLEEVYLKMRAWIKPHPNMGLFVADDITCCPTCGSSDMTQEGSYSTYVNTYDTHRCNSCGSLSRSRKTSVSKDKKQNLLVSLPN